MTINKIYPDVPVYEFLDNGRVLHFHFSTSGKPDLNADYLFDVRDIDMDLQRVYYDRCAIVGSIEPFNRELWYELIKPAIYKAIQSGQIIVPAGEYCV
jgi:hypothetical protein